MEVIDKKILLEKRKELYKFVSQYGAEYVNNVVGSLLNNIVSNSSFEQMTGIIHKPSEYMTLAQTEDEMMFYHLIDMMLVMQWNSIVDLSPRMLQLFSKLGILRKEYDLYLEFYSLLKGNGFLNGNCLEVAAGEYPRLSEIVSKDLNENGHNLIIYEPNTILSKMQHATIIRDKFSKKTNISNIDTLFGMFPCEATIPLAEKAFEENKNLILAFCACDHSTVKYPHHNGDYWCEDVYMQFRKKYGNEAEIINWTSQYSFRCPIMIRRKK